MRTLKLLKYLISNVLLHIQFYKIIHTIKLMNDNK